MAMRRRNFEFHPEAIIEAKEAADWYAKRSLNAAANFKTALRRAEGLILRSPETCAERALCAGLLTPHRL